jgi:hypothetical protein
MDTTDKLGFSPEWWKSSIRIKTAGVNAWVKIIIMNMGLSSE